MTGGGSSHGQWSMVAVSKQRMVGSWRWLLRDSGPWRPFRTNQASSLAIPHGSKPRFSCSLCSHRVEKRAKSVPATATSPCTLDAYARCLCSTTLVVDMNGQKPRGCWYDVESQSVWFGGASVISRRLSMLCMYVCMYVCIYIYKRVQQKQNKPQQAEFEIRN